MSSSEPNTQHLTLLLMKEEVASYDDALEDAASCEAIELAPGAPFEGRFYLGSRSPHPPAWAPFVRAGVASDLTGLLNASTSGVLMLRAGGRLFALTFGFGRWLLRADSFERDFGLKVVLNKVNPDRLRSVELRVIEDVVISRRTDLSRVSSAGSFGLDPGRDILRGVVGQPTDQTLYGRQIAGSDAVQFGLKVQFNDLGSIAERFLDAYNDTRYMTRFGWVDHVKLVRDKSRIADLDLQLDAGLRSETEPRPYLASPAMLAWENVEFGYPRDQGRHDDLDLFDYLNTVRSGQADAAALRRDVIRAFSIDSGMETNHWDAYSCLVFETKLDGQTYVLSEGQWFQVAGNLADDVRDGVARIPLSRLQLPNALAKEWEGDYNSRAVTADPRLALLDKVLSRVAAERGPIEICDILTPQGEFVHVKRKTQSATLSHLFSQGRISAEVLKRDPEVRTRVKAQLQAGHPEIADLIPDGNSHVADGQLEVVFAIVTSDRNGVPTNLPFFSRLNLLRTYEYLTGTLGFRASILGIGIGN
jgi:uncharacterized protein (TIGR04141 family)